MGLPRGLVEEVYKKIYAGHFERYLANMKDFLNSEAEAFKGNDNELRGIEKCRNLLLSSFFVSVYGFLESELKGECASSGGNWKSYKKDGKSDIEAALECLKGLGYQVADDIDWEEINGYYRPLRNCIAHCSGVLNDCQQNEKLKKYIQGNPMALSISSSGVILLSADFCENALDKIMKFLVSVLFSKGK